MSVKNILPVLFHVEEKLKSQVHVLGESVLIF